MLNGDKNDGSGACVRNASATVDPADGEPIAAQCCMTNGTCVRWIGSNDDEGCVGGWYHNNQGLHGPSPKDAAGNVLQFVPTSHTFEQAARVCYLLGALHGLDLTLCDKSCKGFGCRCAPI